MLYNALIRTHHITSRKKVSALKQAAHSHNCFALLRSGGCPGIMYVEAKEKEAVESWVNVVRSLRYKDFQLVNRPAAAMVEEVDDKENSHGNRGGRKDSPGVEEVKAGLSEIDTVKEFGSIMEQRRVWKWWRKGMGYVS
ncbi:hypothetical protein BJX63DRAFT_434816 [Aspergillus granulosus]|uniref:PH domain-containing protein n=1 Tax=Aspergillus granulosus TaxID=176169 RepID=A0ABR4H315_9EURO